MNVLEHSSSRMFLIAALLILFASVSFFSQPRTAAASTSTTGVIVPLYPYLGPMWQDLLQAKQAHPSVPVIAAINPSNGPGSYQDPNILQGVSALQAAGITVIGYVPTEYAARSLSSVESEVSAYSSFYGVSGIFFDQMSNIPGYEWYYSTLTNYVHSAGMSLSVGNPGTNVPSSFVGTVDLIVIYENAGLPSISSIVSGTDGYSRQNFAITSYDVGYVSDSYISSASNYVSYMYITDGQYPDPYTALPSYFSSLMSDIAALNSGGGSNGGSTGSVSLTVNSAAPDGTPVNGLWTVISSPDGSILATGYTPFTYSAVPGADYAVSVSNYGQYVFSNWGNGATSNEITVSPTQDTTLTAYYNTGSSQSTSPSQAPLTVDSASLGGSPVSGLRVIIQSSDGSIVAKGFTPLTYEATAGEQYTVTVDNYGSYIFNNWGDGTTSNSITVTPTAATTLTADYQTSSSSSSPATVTLESAGSNGALFNGMWMVIRSTNGQILTTGFTTMKFGATSGSTYVITASNYGSLIFSHWSNGSTSSTITVSASGALTLVAYYS